MSPSLPLPVLLLPYAVLEKQLIIQVLWILSHSSILPACFDWWWTRIARKYSQVLVVLGCFCRFSVSFLFLLKTPLMFTTQAPNLTERCKMLIGFSTKVTMSVPLQVNTVACVYMVQDHTVYFVAGVRFSSLLCCSWGVWGFLKCLTRKTLWPFFWAGNGC